MAVGAPNDAESRDVIFPAAYLRVVSVICRPLLQTERDADPDDFDRMETVDEVVQAMSVELGAEKAIAVARALGIAPSATGGAAGASRRTAGQESSSGAA